MKLKKIERYRNNGVLKRRYFTDNQYRWQGYSWSITDISGNCFKMYWMNDMHIALRITDKNHYHI